MQPLKSHQSISNVLLLNSSAISESTTVKVNKHRNVDVMLQCLRMVNGSQECVRVKRFVLHTTSSSS